MPDDNIYGFLIVNLMFGRAIIACGRVRRSGRETQQLPYSRTFVPIFMPY